MARVDNIIFCLKIHNLEDQGVNAVTVLSAITPEFIPGQFSFAVIISLLDLDYETNHVFSVEFLAPDGEKIINIENQPLPNQPIGDSNLPNEYKGINIAMEWANVKLLSSGLYTLKFLYDGNEIKEKGIYIKGKNE